MQLRFSEYLRWQPQIYSIAGSQALGLVLRQLFNLKKKKEANLLALDFFLTIDVVCAGVCAGLFWVISLQDYSALLGGQSREQRGQKDSIDLMVAFVFVLIWARPFMLFLVVPSVSKMLLTLVAMLRDVIPLLGLVVCYLIGMT